MAAGINKKTRKNGAKNELFLSCINFVAQLSARSIRASHQTKTKRQNRRRQRGVIMKNGMAATWYMGDGKTMAWKRLHNKRHLRIARARARAKHLILISEKQRARALSFSYISLASVQHTAHRALSAANSARAATLSPHRHSIAHVRRLSTNIFLCFSFASVSEKKAAAYQQGIKSRALFLRLGFKQTSRQRAKAPRAAAAWRRRKTKQNGTISSRGV